MHLRFVIHFVKLDSKVYSDFDRAGASSTGRVASNRLVLVDSHVLNGRLDGNLLGHALQGVLALELLQLLRRVLLEELINGEVTATNTNLDAVTLNLDLHASLSELVDTR